METRNQSNDLPFYQPTGDEIELFERAWRNRLPLLIKGPTGVGKTRFVGYMAAKLGLPLYTVACHDDLTAADLVGRHLIGDGTTYWSDGPLTRARARRRHLLSGRSGRSTQRHHRGAAPARR